MSEKDYNGWANYATWAANLWLENCEGSYYMVRELAEGCIQSGLSRGLDRDEVVFKCSEMIEEAVSESLPELEGLYCELLAHMLSQIDWYQIAEHIVDDMLEELGVDLAE